MRRRAGKFEGATKPNTNEVPVAVSSVKRCNECTMYEAHESFSWVLEGSCCVKGERASILQERNAKRRDLSFPNIPLSQSTI